MNWSENYCPFRITKDTIQFGCPEKIPREKIPEEGVCSVSNTRREVCCYPTNAQFCPLRINQDFCDKPWAKGETEE